MQKPDERAPIVVEWRSGGHRLAYVAALAEHSPEGLVLVTTDNVVSSSEFATLLSGLESAGAISVEVDRRLDLGWRGLARVLRDLRHREAQVVLPEADRFLWLALSGRFTRRSPSDLGLIVMRPPGASDGAPLQQIALLVLKWLPLSLIAWLPLHVDLMLLEDPLAIDTTRTWRRPFRSNRFRLDDPQDLFDGDNVRPAELQFLHDDAVVISLMGSIDERKRLLEILEAWPPSAASGAWLVVAGRQATSVRDKVAQLPHIPNVKFVDRFLTNPELNWVLDRSHGLVLLYDGGVSSGILSSAAARGRWVICSARSRTGRVALGHGFCIPVEGGEPLSQALLRCIAETRSPRATALATRATFAARVLFGHKAAEG